MSNDDFSNLEIAEAYDNLVATRTEIPSVNTAVRDRYGTVVIDYRQPDGADSRTGASMSYVCGTCFQETPNPLTHQASAHRDVAQTVSMQLVGLTPLRHQRGR